MRSNRASVERGIREMWSALSEADDENTYEEARTVERNALAELERQERMEDAALDMYEALKLAEIRLSDAIRIFRPKGQDLADIQAAVAHARVAILKAEAKK